MGNRLIIIFIFDVKRFCLHIMLLFQIFSRHWWHWFVSWMWRSKKFRNWNDSLFNTHWITFYINGSMYVWCKKSYKRWHMCFDYLCWSFNGYNFFIYVLIWNSVSNYLDIIILCFGMQCLFLGYKKRLGFITTW